MDDFGPWVWGIFGGVWEGVGWGVCVDWVGGVGVGCDERFLGGGGGEEGGEVEGGFATGDEPAETDADVGS